MSKTRIRNRVNFKRGVVIEYGDHDDSKDRTDYIGTVTYYNVRTTAQAIRRFFCEHRDDRMNLIPMRVTETAIR